MSRETYRGPSEQTQAAIADVSEFAKEWGKSQQYVHSILSGDSSDPYLKFKLMFRTAARTNREGARGFINDLLAVLNEGRPGGTDAALDAAWFGFRAAVSGLEAGMSTDADVEKARDVLIETLARSGRPRPVEVERDLSQTAGV